MPLSLKRLGCLESWSFEAVPWFKNPFPQASCTMLLLSSASFLEKRCSNSKRDPKSQTLSLACQSWPQAAGSTTPSGWLGAWGRQPGAGTRSPLAEEVQGLGTPALVQQQQHWWWRASSGAAHVRGWRLERDKSGAGWAQRSQQDLLRGRSWPVSRPASWNWTLLVASASLGLGTEQDKLHH